MIVERERYQPFEEHRMTAELAGFQFFSQDNQKSGSISNGLM
jgi:hypothetical protein